MPQLVPFASNTIDRSNSAGFQWEFYCFRCGNGYLSTFRAPTHIAAEAGGALAHQAGNVASDAMNDGAHSAALKVAIAEVAPMFAQCPRCGRWSCRQHCWNANAGLCLDCAPYAAVPTPPAQPWNGGMPAGPVAPSSGYVAPAPPYQPPYVAPYQPPYQPPYVAPMVVMAPVAIAPMAIAYAVPLPLRAKLTGPNPLLVGLIGGVFLFLLIAALYSISARGLVDPNTGGLIVVIVVVVSLLTIGFAAAALRGSVGGATLAGLISGGIGSLGFGVGEWLGGHRGGVLMVNVILLGLILLTPLALGAGAGLGALGGLIGRLLYKG